MGFGISRCAKRILDPYQVTHYKAFRISNCYGSFLTNQYIWERNRGFFGGSHGQMCTNGIQHNHETPKRKALKIESFQTESPLPLMCLFFR